MGITDPQWNGIHSCRQCQAGPLTLCLVITEKDSDTSNRSDVSHSGCDFIGMDKMITLTMPTFLSVTFLKKILDHILKIK